MFSERLQCPFKKKKKLYEFFSWLCKC